MKPVWDQFADDIGADVIEKAVSATTPRTDQHMTKPAGDGSPPATSRHEPGGMGMTTEARARRPAERDRGTLIAIILGLMTVITFANVIARYVFNSNILWALETTVFLFAWLVLLGASYCVKTRPSRRRRHLEHGVARHPAHPRDHRGRLPASHSACFCSIGSWNYWAPFALARRTIWYEVNDIPMPGFLRFIEDAMNEGEAYEKLPRFIPYALPIGLLLTDPLPPGRLADPEPAKPTVIIASHEAEDLVAEASASVDKRD